MKKILLFLVFCAAVGRLAANDCAFYAAGNQLIPINETDIRVQKEILTINRVGKQLEVTVYYEFFNPVGEKDLLVGFEAPSPYNGAYFKNFPEQPYMHDFKVVMNGKISPMRLAMSITSLPQTVKDFIFLIIRNKKTMASSLPTISNTEKSSR